MEKILKLSYFLAVRCCLVGQRREIAWELESVRERLTGNPTRRPFLLVSSFTIGHVANKCGQTSQTLSILSLSLSVVRKGLFSSFSMLPARRLKRLESSLPFRVLSQCCSIHCVNLPPSLSFCFSSTSEWLIHPCHFAYIEIAFAYYYLVREKRESMQIEESQT